MSETLPTYPQLLDRDDLRVLVWDAGGARGRSMQWKLRQSPHVDEVFLGAGNAREGVRAALETRADLVVPCAEDMLAEGIVDQLAVRGIAAYGPTRQAAKLEWWKPYAKKVMIAAGVPTTPYKTFRNPKRAHDYLDKRGYGVLKVPGLARGKGVLVCLEDLDAGHTFIEEAMVRRRFGNAGRELLIEDPADGVEFSMHAAAGFGSDSQVVFKPFISSQDHKQLCDGDTGPNTAGIGVVAPVIWLPQPKINTISEKVIRPPLEYLHEQGIDFRGILYPGLMGEHVLEYNVREGSPEWQAYVRPLKTDFVELMVTTLNNRLDEVELVWEDKHVIVIVACARGYPGKPQTGLEIHGLEAAQAYDGVEIFRAGVVEQDGKLLTNGGRVVEVSAMADSPEQARELGYAALQEIRFGDSADNMHYRTDIGLRPVPVGF